MPEEPGPLWRLIGPGIVAGVGLPPASSSFIPHLPGLLILINRKSLPAPINVSGYRLGVLIWAIALFGTLSVLTFREQLGKLFGG